ncbi:hypothetical protein Droror1_Dr00025680 [Drosera rotundifolia]
MRRPSAAKNLSGYNRPDEIALTIAMVDRCRRRSKASEDRDGIRENDVMREFWRVSYSTIDGRKWVGDAV